MKVPSAFENAESALRLFESFLFYGKYRCGKTTEAYGLAYKYVSMGFSAEVVTAMDFYHNLRRNQNSDDNMYEVYKNIDYLCIDDLGTEKPTDWMQSMFISILNHRFMWNLPTVITTNLELDELSDHIETRMYSRIMENYEIIHYE